MTRTYIEDQVDHHVRSWSQLSEAEIATKARQYEKDLIFAGAKILGSQEALARVLGLKPGNLSRYKSDRAMPHGKVHFLEYGVLSILHKEYKSCKDWVKAVRKACKAEVSKDEIHYIVESLRLKVRIKEIAELVSP